MPCTYVCMYVCTYVCTYLCDTFDSKTAKRPLPLLFKFGELCICMYVENCIAQTPIFSNPSLLPRVKFAQRVNWASRGVLCPLGDMFTPSFTPGDEHCLLLEDLHPQGTTSPLGPNFIPGGNFCPCCEI
jgi:hypothetical protein